MCKEFTDRYTVRVEEESAKEHERDDDNRGDGQGNIHVGGDAGEEVANRENNLPTFYGNKILEFMS